MKKGRRSIALEGGYAMRWEGSPEIWKRAESIFAVPFTSQLREQVEIVTNIYAMFGAIFGLATEEKVRERLEKLISAGNDVMFLFHSDANVGARILAGDTRPRRVEAVPGRPIDELGELSISLSDALVKAHTILVDLDKYTAEDVNPWDAWVSWLTQIMNNCSLPTGASNHSDKSSSETTPSKFVQFIALLDDDVWKERPSPHRGWAEAKAINRARKPHPKKLDWDTSVAYWEARSRFLTRMFRLGATREVPHTRDKF